MVAELPLQALGPMQEKSPMTPVLPVQASLPLQEPTPKRLGVGDGDGVGEGVGEGEGVGDGDGVGVSGAGVWPTGVRVGRGVAAVSSGFAPARPVGRWPPASAMMRAKTMAPPAAKAMPDGRVRFMIFLFLQNYHC
jgi:hypothetical protein